MLNKILTFLQILELLGKWTLKLIKNYHITAGFLLILSVLCRTEETTSSRFLFDIILILLLTIGIRHKKLSKARNSNYPNINILNQNIIKNNNKP